MRALLRYTTNDLGSIVYGEVFVARIDALRRKGQAVVTAGAQSPALKQREQQLLGSAREGGTFQHNKLAPTQPARDLLCRVHDVRDIWLLVFPQGCWHTDRHDIHLGELLEIACRPKIRRKCSFERGSSYITDRADSIVEGRHPFSIDIKSHDGEACLCKCNCQGQTHITQTDHSNSSAPSLDTLQECVNVCSMFHFQHCSSRYQGNCTLSRFPGLGKLPLLRIRFRTHSCFQWDRVQSNAPYTL